MDDLVLCQWLRDNSSGVYRPSSAAADRIETQNHEIRQLKIAVNEAINRPKGVVPDSALPFYTASKLD